MSVFSLFDLFGTAEIKAVEQGLLPGGQPLVSRLNGIGTALGLDVAELEANGVPGWVVGMAFFAGAAAAAIGTPVVLSVVAGGAAEYGLAALLTPAVTTFITAVSDIGISKLASELVTADYQGIASLVQDVGSNASAAYNTTSVFGALPVPSNISGWDGTSPSLFNLVDSKNNIIGSFSLTSNANGTVVRIDYAGPNQKGAVVATEVFNANGSTNTTVNPGQTYTLPAKAASTPNDTLTVGAGASIILDARAPYQGQIKGFNASNTLIITNTSVLTDPVLTLSEPGTPFALSGTNGHTWLDVYFISAPFGIDIGPAGPGNSYTLHVQSIGGGAEAVTLVPVQSTSQPLTLAAGSLTGLQFGQDSGDSFIFAGTASLNAPKLEFLGTGANGSPSINSVGSLTVQGKAGAPTFGSVYQSGASNVSAGGGLQVSDGTLTDAMAPGTSFTANGNSQLTNGGSANFISGGQGIFNVNGTITLGAGGSNALNLQSVDTQGRGVIAEQGEFDLVTVGAVADSGGTSNRQRATLRDNVRRAGHHKSDRVLRDHRTGFGVSRLGVARAVRRNRLVWRAECHAWQFRHHGRRPVAPHRFEQCFHHIGIPRQFGWTSVVPGTGARRYRRPSGDQRRR